MADVSIDGQRTSWDMEACARAYLELLASVTVCECGHAKHNHCGGTDACFEVGMACPCLDFEPTRDLVAVPIVTATRLRSFVAGWVQAHRDAPDKLGAVGGAAVADARGLIEELATALEGVK